MYFSNENEKQIEKRLLKVLQTADLKVFAKPYTFVESSFSDKENAKNCLAMVRDSDVWSYLVPAVSTNAENFKLLCIHFKEGFDNSGFVGWLASKIKNEFGSGVFVVCGQNSKRGGVFDYWGSPIEVGDEIVGFIEKLKQNGYS